MSVLISICIPAYNSGSKLERLLESIKVQTFKDYEIIISDDSNNDGVRNIAEKKYAELNIQYYHNAKPLGTPANWNNAILKAKGQWIKLMHHDDWMLDENTLQTFVDHIPGNDGAKLIYCAFKNINTDTDSTSDGKTSWFESLLLKWNYLNLFKNFIGNPSCTLVSSALKPYEYDKRIKWLIDFDFYTWYFTREKKVIYIDKPLIAFRIHAGQVTAQTQQNPVVEIPESFILYEKYGIKILKNVFVYDFFWRMYRNLGIKSIPELEKYLGYECKYPAIVNMIKLQHKVPEAFLKNGFSSKMLMLSGYLRNRFFTRQY